MRVPDLAIPRNMGGMALQSSTSDVRNANLVMLTRTAAFRFGKRRLSVWMCVRVVLSCS